MWKNSKFLILPVVTTALLLMGFSADYPMIEHKTIKGYSLDCQSYGEHLFIQKTGSKQKPFDFCSEGVVSLILNTSSKIQPNFGGDLKLIKVNPLINSKPQNKIAFVAIVDDKDKEIVIDDTIYFTADYYTQQKDYTDEKEFEKTEKDKAKKISTDLGKLYSTKNSFMYCFYGKIGYAREMVEFIPPELEDKGHICKVYINDKEQSYQGYILDNDYHFNGGKLPEQTEIAQTLKHRTAKQLIK